MSQELREEARRREQERRIREQREYEFENDVRQVASTPEGKRLLRRLLEKGDLFGSSWTPGAAGAYQAGRRAQALELWRILRNILPRAVCLDLVLPAVDGNAEAVVETAEGCGGE